MHGAWNELQALGHKDCQYAYCVHCLGHQLQQEKFQRCILSFRIWFL